MKLTESYKIIILIVFIQYELVMIHDDPIKSFYLILYLNYFVKKNFVKKKKSKFGVTKK
jgi:hypothetical protein